jgi:protein phosphatase
VVSAERTTVANVGDSRAYLLHDQRPRQVTIDHSWVAGEVAAGRLDAALAGTHPSRGHLVRAITGDPVEVDLFTLSPVAGDVLVLCSDGVWGVLDDSLLAASFTGTGGLAEQVQRACRSALAAGSRDNVTVVACRVERGEPR